VEALPGPRTLCNERRNSSPATERVLFLLLKTPGSRPEIFDFGF